MAAVQLPISFPCVGAEKVAAPLTLVQRTVASLAPHELLVRVSHSSVNPYDKKLVTANRLSNPFPLIPGLDFAGTVVAVGGPASEAQEAIDVGSEVFGMQMHCKCFAQYAVVTREFTALRGAIPPEEAAALPGVFFTAADGLLFSGEVSRRAGQWIYVAGAAGGVGHIAVQLAKLHGMRVIGSASKPASLQLLRTLGVDVVLDYSKQHIAKEVLAATDGKGADVVYDPTYSLSSYAQSAACVAAGGAWVKLGLDRFMPGAEAYSKVAQARGATALQPTMGRWFAEFGHGEQPYMSEQHRMTQTLRDAVGWYHAGQVRPYITRTVECEPEALQRVLDELDSINVGKVAVRMPEKW